MKKNKNTRKPNYPVILLLVISTIIAFSGVLNSDFTNCDDNAYVTQNGHVKEGLSGQTIVWAFTSFEHANWHPLTWLSLALDNTLFGQNSAYYHGMNLFLHLLTSILLFLILDRITQARWQSAFVACVFAIHPIHVESVAWVSERKDVLAGLFWMLTIGTYILYHQSSEKKYYYLMLVVFALGLLSKPLLVTLPFVLLLLDYWPLNRISLNGMPATNDKHKPTASLKKLALEKIPLLLLALASSVITFIAQRQGEAMRLGEALPVQDRIANAIISYAQYIGKAFVPVDLTVFYPHPEQNYSLGLLIVSILVLLVITFVVWKQKTQRPFLVTGWCWFLGTLVPMIGIVQVGMQAMADRYMYVPIIGLAIMVAWGVPSFMNQVRMQRSLVTWLFALLIPAMMYGTYVQVSHWKNNTTLFEHALSVTKDNYFAHYCLGLDLADSGKTDAAVQHFREAIRIKASFAPTYNNLAAALSRQGKFDEAIEYFQESFRRMPSHASAYNNYGVTLAQLGKLDEAATQWQRAVEIDPYYADPHANLGRLYALQGKTTEAIEQFETALRLNANHVDAQFNYGNLLAGMKKFDEATYHYREALRIAPGFLPARKALETIGNVNK